MHVVLFRWRPGTDPGHGERLAKELRALAAQMPSLHSYRCGPDLDLSPDTYDFAVACVADSAEGLATYLGHPGHHAVVAELVTPVLAERISSQVAWEPAVPPLG